MKLFNTLTNQKEEFIPIKEGEVNMYVCGPTVYNYIHLGNARPFTVFDVLRRYLKYKGYKVKYVQNFTDVDDKIINRSKEEGISPKEVADKYIAEYKTDAKGLGITEADVHPRVSETMTEIIDFIQTLVEKGYAYKSEDGSVYYRVNKFSDYGKLSHQSKDELMSGARVEVNDTKENPLDFALWKAKKEGEPYWESPWGEGRPGWHIECSAMSKKYLGETIDIHGGGRDLIFPHHENEIAQSEACSGKEFAHYWLHNGYINVDDVKMSKSLGNFFTIRDISQKFDLEVVRMFILSVQYRSPINFSDESLRQNQAALERLYNVKNNLKYLISHAKDEPLTKDEELWLNELSERIKAFEYCMEDDLNTAGALGEMFEMAKIININASETSTKEALEKALSVFMIPAGIMGLLTKENEELLDEDIQKLIDERQQARAEKNFARSDEIRDLLKAKGIALEDTREGVKWRRI